MKWIIKNIWVLWKFEFKNEYMLNEFRIHYENNELKILVKWIAALLLTFNLFAYNQFIPFCIISCIVKTQELVSKVIPII